VTDSYAYTLDQFRRPGSRSWILLRNENERYRSQSRDSFARPFQSSHPVKEVNRMLKFFIAGQTYVMEKYDALRNSEEGQTMAEYGVVLTVIAIGVIIALTALSGGIGRALDAVTAKFPAA
jgi:Flp pilus assembly pilin Flp